MTLQLPSNALHRLTCPGSRALSLHKPLAQPPPLRRLTISVQPMHSLRILLQRLQADGLRLGAARFEARLETYEQSERSEQLDRKV